MKTKIAKFFKRLTPTYVCIRGKENPINYEEFIVKKADVEEAMNNVTPNGLVVISAGICLIFGIVIGAVFSSNK